MLSSFVLFSSWLSFSCNVFGIVCDLLSLIHILCTCVRFTATFFFWIEGAALLFWTLWYSTTTWHWCHSFQLFSLPVSFHFFSLLPLRETINSVAIGLTFILSFFLYPTSPEGGILSYLCPSFRPSKIFFVTFFSATIDGRNFIFGHKLHIGMPYCGKGFWTRQIPTSCLPT